MPSLLLNEEAKQAFLGALLTVCRVHGRVSPPEMAGLREAAAELVPDLPVDDEWLLFTDVSPAALAEAVRRARAAPFRDAPTTSSEQVGVAFVQAALRVCSRDRPASRAEAVVIRRFGAALGLTSQELDALDASAVIDSTE